MPSSILLLLAPLPLHTWMPLGTVVLLQQLRRSRDAAQQSCLCASGALAPVPGLLALTPRGHWGVEASLRPPLLARGRPAAAEPRRRSRG
eukprot:6896626-Pyramimonas_sp.AAC.1